MQTSLYERSSGRFYANFYAEGRRKRVSLRTSKRGEARRKLVELEDAYADGDFDPFADGLKSDPFRYEEVGREKVESATDVISAFADAKRKQGRSERTIDTYRAVWRRFCNSQALSGVPLDTVTSADVEQFVHDPSVSKATQHKRWRHLKAVLRWADRADLLERIHAPQRPDKLPTPVRKDELSEIVRALKAEYRQKRRYAQCKPGQIIWAIPVFRFVFFSGLRATEIGRLRWKHVDLSRDLIYIHRQKNKRAQTIPLISKARTALRDTPTPRKEDMYVFRTPNGPVKERCEESFGRRVSERFRKARERCCVSEEKTLHDLRAGFATALAEAGMSAHQIKKAMRHSTLRTALKYVNLSRHRLRSEMEDAL